MISDDGILLGYTLITVYGSTQKFLTNALFKKTELELTADFYNGHFTTDRDISLGLEKNKRC